MATTDLTKHAENDSQRPLLALLSNQKVMTRFEQAAGKMAGQVVVNIINAANANPEIYECVPETVITAALNAATMNLSLAGGLGQCAILPFKKNKKVGDKWETTKRAQLVIMVRGVKELAMRTNKYRVLNDFKVYEGQEVVEDQMTGRKSIKGSKKSDTVIGYGAHMQLFSGYEHTVYWTRERVEAHGKKYSPTYNRNAEKFNDGSRWVTNFDEQASKTVIKDLIMNHGVISESDRAMLGVLDDERELGEELSRDNGDDENTVEGETTELPQATTKKRTAAQIQAELSGEKPGKDALRIDDPKIVDAVSKAAGVSMDDAQAHLFAEFDPGALLSVDEAKKFGAGIKNMPPEPEQEPLM